TTLELWNKVTAFPKGKWTFSRMLCLKAPYFGSISPLFIELKPVNKKIGKQLFKDYVFFPLIAGPAALPVFTGNLVANGLR
ncbi:DUF4442 domain-containing protein, partial [Acinetobacter baumannii]|uniref:DUF4442 domain-containing protein n=1 Tax=Acinetobacter baumannii TaxID=470 RepID=UPI001F555845